MIPAIGFCIHLRRLRQEQRTSKKYARTIGDYDCYWNRTKIPELSGQMVERGGPGDNTKAVGDKNDRRIKAGVYPLGIHDGTKFKSIGYVINENHAAMPRPGILLKKTHERTVVLIHPGMDYVWSKGCINPASGLVNANSAISYSDSRARVIAIIDYIKSKVTIPVGKEPEIPECVIFIEGEP